MPGGGAGIGILGSLLGAVGQIGSGIIANKGQQDAIDKSIGFQKDMFDKLQGNLQPYMGLGSQAAGEMGHLLNDFTRPIPINQAAVNQATQPVGLDTNRLDALTKPITMDQAALEQTPGYQFTRTQGLKAVQNSAAARGLGVSGAAMKGAANFATGLADNTYQTQFNIANTNRSNEYNRLVGNYNLQNTNNAATLERIGSGWGLQNLNNNNAFNRLTSIMGTGQSAAAGTGQMGTTFGTNIGESLIGGGNALAGMWNRIGNSIGQFGSDMGGYGMMNYLRQSNPGSQ